ncbi:hypothetical protein L3X38_036268 [Prunus dulcis]|uniref:Uncharacterized protein n=1 Tax=Prunus dulcis TaxID=3755 RepID=A0AAD4V307_PRUDU|nr:hypothetical protein L3X38_036268 [Prunus dulcis]
MMILPSVNRSMMEGVINQLDEIIAPVDVVLPQIAARSIATTLHDGKASSSHDEGETGKTVISGNDKFAGDIPLLTQKLHFDGISHFDLNVVPDIQIYVLASDIDYNATVLLVVPSTIVSFILALAGGFQWKLKHIAQPPGVTETLYLFVTQPCLRLQHVSSAEQLEDNLINGLIASLFPHHYSNLMLGSSKHEIEGGCKSMNDDDIAKCQQINDFFTMFFSFSSSSQVRTLGHLYISDTLHFDLIQGQFYIADSSASIIFGCSTYESGVLTSTHHTGWKHTGPLSVIS